MVSYITYGVLILTIDADPSGLRLSIKNSTYGVLILTIDADPSGLRLSIKNSNHLAQLQGLAKI